MAKLKFRDENDEFIPVVQNVKVNNVSIFDGEKAELNLKTINNESIVGKGNINIQIDSEDYVKTTINQGLTNQQKINARNNIEALGSSNIKQNTGDSTSDVMSQKGITDALANKQDSKPDGTHLLISNDTGKLDLIYIPSTVLGGITNGGTFNGSGIITGSSYAPELDGEKIDEVAFASYPSYYFICSAPYSFAGFDFTYGDWAISLGNGWAKLNATDAVTSVNNKMGQVVLDADDVGAVKKTLGIDYANKNLVTDAQGRVITADYSLGQIIVDYYEELPTTVPENASATVSKPSEGTVVSSEIQEGKEYSSIIPAEEPVIDENASYEEINCNNGGAIMLLQDYNDDAYYQLYYSTDNESEDFYLYSWNETTYGGEQTINIGWNKFTMDYEETGDYVITQEDYENIPPLTNVEIDYLGVQEESELLNNIIVKEMKLKGTYKYVSVPNTDPVQLKWEYVESAVQSDWQQTDDTSLDFIKNKPSIFGKSNNAVRFVSDSLSAGAYSVAGGRSCEATGTDSIAFGNSISANATSSFAIGSGGSVNGNYSGSLGDRNSVTGTNNYVLGAYNSFTIPGSAGSSIVGQGNVCNHSNSVVVGQYLTSGRGMQTVVGSFNETDNDNQFVVGVGTNGNNKKNGMTIDSTGNAWLKNLKLGGTNYATGYNVLNASDIINNVTTTTTNQALSANMGKELQDQITNLKARGRFLSLWDCSTGLATTEPTVNPYTYKTGDYFIVSVADNPKWYYPYTPGDTYNIGDKCSYNGAYYICNTNNTTGNWDASKWTAHTIINYRPTGSSYNKTIPSTTTESLTVDVNDVYYYDGTNWALQINNQAEVTFPSIAGDPMDNASLQTLFNSKINTSAIQTLLTPLSTDSQVPSAKCVYDMVGNIESLLGGI